MSVVAAFIMPHPPLIIPQIGRGEEKQIQRTIDSCIKIASIVAKIQPDTIVLASPHAEMYLDYFHIAGGDQANGNFRQFGVPNTCMSVNYDNEFVNKLCELVNLYHFPAGILGEKDAELDHGTMVPLSFINTKFTNYRLVRIGLSDLSPEEHYTFGKMISATTEKLNRKVVFIASGDLSHKLTADGPYGYAAEGPQFDNEVTECMAKGDFLSFLKFDSTFCESAAECGLRSFWIMSGALDKKSVKAELLSYEGPFGVGYGVASFIVIGDDSSRNFDEQFNSFEENRLNNIKRNEDPYVKLARYSLEYYVLHGQKSKLPADLPAELLNYKAGVFVSLKKDGQLRGCIGTISPVTKCVADEILRNAISACSEDPRFEPVRKDELGKLVYSVDVLGKAEDIKDKSQLDVKRYGVIVTNGYRRGLLLPDIEGVDNVNQQIEIAKGKAGIGKNEPCSLQRFEVIRHK